MSRYAVNSNDSQYDIVVGWDRPLNTLFVIVYDKNKAETDDEIVMWEGTRPEAIHDVTTLEEIIVKYGTIPQDVKDQLYKDMHG